MSQIIQVETIIRAVEGDVRFNVAADARTFDCKFIEPGLISYRDHERGGIELLRRETIERAMPSCVGNPITVGHVLVTAENRLNVEQGIVTDWYFDAGDGWFHVKGYVDGTEAKNRIRRGYKPSCGYIVRAFGPSGKHHDIRFDKEITDLTFNHLAVVERPRFEDAAFRLNSIHVSQPSMNIIKFLIKLVTRENGADGKPTESTKVEAREVPSTTQIEIDGRMVPLSEIAEGYRKNAATAPALEAPLQVAADDQVEIDGKTVLVSDLIAGYRKNAAASAVVPPVAAVIPEGETPEQKATREASLRTNAAAATKPFLTLHNARENAAAPADTATRAKTSGSIADRCRVGQEKYGSLVVVSGKN